MRGMAPRRQTRKADVGGSSNSLHLTSLGQSLWLDQAGAGVVDPRELSRLVARGQVTGVAEADFRPDALRKAPFWDSKQQKQLERERSLQEVRIANARWIAEPLKELFANSGGREGLVGLSAPAEVAYDTESLVEEARRIWSEAGFPNLVVNVPATEEALPAIRELAAEGVNLSAGPILSLRRYQEINNAYLAGLEDRAAAGRPVTRVAALASFPLTLIDEVVAEFARSRFDGSQDEPIAALLRQTVALATARAAHQHYRNCIHSPRFRRLAEAGARSMRLQFHFLPVERHETSANFIPAGAATVIAASRSVTDQITNGRFPVGPLVEHPNLSGRLLGFLWETYPDIDSWLEERLEAEIKLRVLAEDQTVERLLDS